MWIWSEAIEVYGVGCCAADPQRRDQTNLARLTQSSTFHIQNILRMLVSVSACADDTIAVVAYYATAVWGLHEFMSDLVIKGQFTPTRCSLV